MPQQNKKFKILLLSVSSTSFFYEQVVIPFGLVSLAFFVDCPEYEIMGIELNWPPGKIMQRYLRGDNEVLRNVDQDIYGRICNNAIEGFSHQFRKNYSYKETQGIEVLRDNPHSGQKFREKLSKLQEK